MPSNFLRRSLRLAFVQLWEWYRKSVSLMELSQCLPIEFIKKVIEVYTAVGILQNIGLHITLLHANGFCFQQKLHVFVLYFVFFIICVICWRRKTFLSLSNTIIRKLICIVYYSLATENKCNKYHKRVELLYT